MSSTLEDAASARGTLKAPRFRNGVEITDDDTHIRAEAFTYAGTKGVVAGYEIGVTFALDAPAAAVWPHFKAWDLWQNNWHTYSGSPGALYSDEQLGLGTETFRIAAKNAPGVHGKLGGSTTDGRYETDDYIVLRVIPEHLLLIFQPVPATPGAVSPGFHTFVLREQEGRTIINGHMEHAILTDGEPDEELFDYWTKASEGTSSAWHTAFIPALRALVAESTGSK